jgi:phosphatidylinositol-3-phosphatase
VKAFVPLLLAAVVLGCPAAVAAPAVPDFDHVIVILFENKEEGTVLGNPRAPTFNAYAKRYARMTRYYGVTHPSLPNYIALASGSTQGITTNCTTCLIAAKSLADTVEASGRSWKSYAEGLPVPGFLGATSGRYAKKHNPFVYFRSVASNRERRRAHVVPFTQLAKDLKAGQLANFVFVEPDMCNSMHDCGVSIGDRWLRRVAPPLLKLPNTVVFVLFDEGESDARGGGHIPALALGTAVRPGARFAGMTDHYGALRTIEDAWGLPRLGKSAKARPITGIWH